MAEPIPTRDAFATVYALSAENKGEYLRGFRSLVQVLARRPQLAVMITEILRHFRTVDSTVRTPVRRAVVPIYFLRY